MLRKAPLWIMVLLFSSGCGIINISKSGSPSSRFENYSENLAESRMTFSEIPETKPSPEIAATSDPGSGNAVDGDLEEALKHFAEAKQNEPFFNGFTVLVYSGLDRDLAFKTRNDLYSSFPEINAEMQYEQPRYLVKVGRYINRIEALAVYEKLKAEFPATRIIQDRFRREIKNSEQDLENVEG